MEPNVGQESFIIDDPLNLLKYGEIVDVPIMIGTSKDEASFLLMRE